MIVRQFLLKKPLSVQQVLSIFQQVNATLYCKSPHCVTIGLFPRQFMHGKAPLASTIYRRVPALPALPLQGPPDCQLFASLYGAGETVQRNLLAVVSAYWAACPTVPALSTQPADAAVFGGGLMGFAGYDLAASQSLALARQQGPTGLFGDYDIFLQQVPADAASVPDTGPDSGPQTGPESMPDTGPACRGWWLYGPDDVRLQPLYAAIDRWTSPPAPPHALAVAGGVPFQVQQAFAPVWTFADYQQAFAAVQEFLRAGDCYQVNLTQPFKARVQGQLLACLDALEALTRAAYAGYVRHDDFELLSCSPELFLRFDANRQVITRPIKGTRPRHADPLVDAALKAALADSAKDRSENLMIVDLLRNDLGRHAQTGSVQVPVLFEIQSFAQVHHLVSEIRATLLPDASPLGVLLAAMPGGSITGAPKIRAMQIIDALEAEPRGAYCGSMGFLNYDGSGVFNILIRTLQRHGEVVTAWAGGGITIASDCEAEYQECLDKIGAILQCVQACGSQPAAGPDRGATGA